MKVVPEKNVIEMLTDSNGRPTSTKYTFAQLFRDEPQDDIVAALCKPMVDAIKEDGRGAYLI